MRNYKVLIIWMKTDVSKKIANGNHSNCLVIKNGRILLPINQFIQVWYQNKEDINSLDMLWIYIHCKFYSIVGRIAVKCDVHFYVVK